MFFKRPQGSLRQHPATEHIDTSAAKCVCIPSDRTDRDHKWPHVSSDHVLLPSEC